METADTAGLIVKLKARFEKHSARHPGIEWRALQARLEASELKTQTLFDMERTGGEPDVIGFNPASDQYTYCDCSAESPAGRRSLCFDQAALDARKENKPAGSAMDLAARLGIEMLCEAQYRALQGLGAFDTKTSSWVQTPAEFRKLGGALFGDRRYGRVFVYHNGAESYYASRGFRGWVSV